MASFQSPFAWCALFCGLVIPSAGAQESPEAAEAVAEKTMSKEERAAFVRKILPEGRVDVDVMEIAFSAERMAILRKLQHFMQENPDWFLEQISKRAPGEGLPYDERMGVTEEEYAQLDDMSGMSARKASTAKLRIRNVDGVLTFYSTSLPGLHNLELDLEKDRGSVESRIPKQLLLDQRSEIHAREKSVLGPWDGVKWKSKPVNVVGALIPGISGRSVSIAIGKKVDSNRAVIYFRESSLTRTGQVGKREHILEFDLAKD